MSGNEFLDLCNALRNNGGGVGKTKSGLCFVVPSLQPGPACRVTCGSTVFQYQTLGTEGRESFSKATSLTQGQSTLNIVNEGGDRNTGRSVVVIDTLPSSTQVRGQAAHVFAALLTSH